MGNRFAIVEAHRTLLLRFGVANETVERIDYDAIINDHGEAIQLEINRPLKKRMPVLPAEHIIIVMDLFFLHQYTKRFICEFNQAMLDMGFLIYMYVPLRARYHMEALKRAGFDFNIVLANYMLPEPEIAMEPFDPMQLMEQLEEDEEPEGVDPPDPVVLPDRLELGDRHELLPQLWNPDMMLPFSFWHFDEICIANTQQDDEEALGIAGDLPLDDLNALFE